VLPVAPRPPEPTLERAFAERISRARISEFHRRLTERPHRSGTDGAHAVARYLESTLREAGLEVEVEEYQAFLSAPKRVTVDILAPSPEPLSLWEPADPRDPDSSHPDLEPAWIAFSGSGSETGDVVYAEVPGAGVGYLIETPRDVSKLFRDLLAQSEKFEDPSLEWCWLGELAEDRAIGV
jgi:hypothetical protein